MSEDEYVSRQPPRSLAEKWRDAIDGAYGRVEFRRRMVDAHPHDTGDHRVDAVRAALAELRETILEAADSLRQRPGE